MRHNAKRYSKGRGNQNNNNKPNRMKVFDSNGPDARIRGTAYQVTEKYEALARDAETSGNTVLAENYRQHAEHYQRVINSFEAEMAEKQAPQVAEKKTAAPQGNANSNAEVATV